MKDTLELSGALKLGALASDPVTAENGAMYYNSTLNVIRQYVNGGWTTVTAGSISLTGQTLLENEIVVGNSSDLSATVDTSAVGDILAHSTNGLTIKSGVIVDADINASAAITRSKLATATANTLATNDGSGNLSTLSLTSGQIVVGNGSGVPAAVSVSGDLTLSNTGDAQIAAGAIVNADVNASAAIALTKLAALTANRLTETDGSGFITASALQSADVILRTGTVAFTADQSMGGNQLTNVGDPLSAQDAATKAYVDSVAQGLKPKTAVRVGSLANIVLASALENGDVVDGVTLATNDRVLVKNQTLPEENGIYIVQATGAAVRSTDFDSLSPIDEINGAYTFIQEGTQAGQGWVQAGTVATLGTDPITFVYFNSAATVVGGDMITVSGSTISVDLATVSGLESTNPGNVAGELRVKLEASNPSLQIDGSNQLGAKLDAAGAITSGASGLIVGVDNSTVEISSNALRVKDLGITNAKLASNAVTDAKVDAAAAIARSKLASGTANRVVVNNGSGVMSDAAAITAARALISDANGIPTHSTVTDTELSYVSGVTSAIQTQLTGKASTALSNLASVAINTTLVSDTNNTDDLGTDAIEWKDAWVHRVAHNDATNPNLTVETTGNNGSIITKAHGTGNSDVQATKLRRSESGASSNFIEEQYLHAVTLTASQTNTVLSELSFAHASYSGIEVSYTIKEATTNRLRLGTLRIVSNGTDISVVDNFASTADVGVSWSAVINGASVDVRYTTTANNKTLRADVKRFAA